MLAVACGPARELTKPLVLPPQVSSDTASSTKSTFSGNDTCSNPYRKRRSMRRNQGYQLSSVRNERTVKSLGKTVRHRFALFISLGDMAISIAAKLTDVSKHRADHHLKNQFLELTPLVVGRVGQQMLQLEDMRMGTRYLKEC